MSKNGSLDINEIKEQIKLIEDSFCYYVSCNGNVYKKDKHCKFLKKKLNYHKNGYVYTMYINKSGKIITRRVHRLVATAFIENQNNYTIVGHKNNIKTDNRVENLYWTTPSENTKKAFDDGLLVNDKGYDDSQSFPVIVYDKNLNQIDEVGSVSICSKVYNVSKSTITRHCKNEIHGKTRCGYYFKYKIS